MSVLGAGKILLRGVYAVHKLAPVRKGRVAIISRQSDTPSVDIRLLKRELEKDSDMQVRVLCKSLDGGLLHKAGYLLHMIGPQMHAIATSEVVVLDSYCIAVSILNHKKDLKVIQMWHAMGALKRFGKSILGQEEGSSRALAEALDMHRGYDAILVSSESCLPYFAEAFGYPESAFWVLPLPRVDLLRDKAYQASQKERILAAHPELSNKRIILYAPTMRKTEDDITRPLALAEEACRYEDTVLVVSPHPVMSRQYETMRSSFEQKRAVFLPEYSTLELLPLCDAFVSDYSAMIYEAAAAGKPVYLYAYDLDKYQSARGFYLDYETEMPGQPMQTARDVMGAVHENACTASEVQAFADKYIVQTDRRCTEILAERIRSISKT